MAGSVRICCACAAPCTSRNPNHDSQVTFPTFPGIEAPPSSRGPTAPNRRCLLKCSSSSTDSASSSSPKVWKSGLVRPVRIRAYSQELAVIALRMFAVVLYKCLVVAAHTVILLILLILLVLVHTAHTAHAAHTTRTPIQYPIFFSVAQWYSLVATPIQYPSFFCCCSVVLSTPIQYPDPVVLCLVLHFYNGEEEVSC